MNNLSFTAAGELFAVDVTLVMKVARRITVTPVPAAPAAVVGLANLKGRIVTILNLGVLLNAGSGGSQVEGETGGIECNAVIFKPFTSGGDLMGLLIDKPGDLADISEEDIHAPPKTADSGANFCVSGVAEVGGKLYRIIDVESIVNKFSEGVDENERV